VQGFGQVTVVEPGLDPGIGVHWLHIRIAGHAGSFARIGSMMNRDSVSDSVRELPGPWARPDIGVSGLQPRV
jgi:hypothetical protein